MTPGEQAQAFVRAARGKRLTLREIAEASDLSLEQARDVLTRGVALKRLKVRDEDRLHVWIEVVS